MIRIRRLIYQIIQNINIAIIWHDGTLLFAYTVKVKFRHLAYIQQNQTHPYLKIDEPLMQFLC